jgi:uncharacterized protein (DUF1697 family)
MATHVALLRGINVGGKNLIKMADLKGCFEANGYVDVVTYIQSGNVLFTARSVAAAELADRIERMLKSTFGHYEASVVLRTRAQMRAIVDRAPTGFGTDPEGFRYDVIFLKPPLTAKVAMRSVSIREGVDEVVPGTGVLYSSRLVSRLTQSRLNKIVGTPAYANMTIRNWNTTTKLTAMLDAT